MSSIYIVDIFSIYLTSLIALGVYGLALYNYPKYTIFGYLTLTAYVIMTHADTCMISKNNWFDTLWHMIWCNTELVFFYMQLPFIMISQLWRIYSVLAWNTRAATTNTLFPW